MESEVRKVTRRIRVASFLLAVPFATTMLLGTTANAATNAAAKQPQQTVITVPMTIVYGAPPAGVSPYAPKLAGSQPAIPQNQVNGNCGYSYFYINNAGGGNGHMFYGFHTNRTGYDYFSQT